MRKELPNSSSVTRPASPLRLLLAGVLLVMQLGFAAHAFADADHSSIEDCRVCQQAERQDHAIPPACYTLTPSVPGSIPEVRSSQAVLHSKPREIRNKAPPAA
ncbi:MAG: hypothetical protein R3217_02015 [Gammaproteobacteria bacterium]|nr:hypothetical protein [Gammaproteobacteria bacterium]